MAELSHEQHIRRASLEQLADLLRVSEEDYICYISIPALQPLERTRAFDMLDILEHEDRVKLRRSGNDDRSVALTALGKLSLEQSEEDWQSSGTRIGVDLRMGEDKTSVLAELSDYEAKLRAIENRFQKTSGAIWIRDGDAEYLLQYVRELISLLDSVLGKANEYSRQISAYYGNGIHNMRGSPSLQSVRDIISMVKAVQTHIKRPTTVLPQGGIREFGPGANVFIGHGHSKEWLALKDFIFTSMQLPVDEFNQEPVAGIGTKERLSTMLDRAAIAFLVLTAEDETGDGGSQARMNVVHEVGLFQGRLGFNKAIVMLEEGCREFSNIAGLGHIQFPKNNIQASFYEVERVLQREGLKKAPDR